MNEELETKKEWATPEIVDLDVDRTAGGTLKGGTEKTWVGYVS